MKLFKGQSMLEVLVALGAAVVVLTSITIAVITSLSNSQFSENQNVATHYAQEGLDSVRKFRDSDYAVFSETDGTYCLGEEDTVPGTVGECDRPNVENFVREISIRHGVNSCNEEDPALVVSEVTSRVAWTDGRCSSNNAYCHEVRLVSCLSDIATAPAL